MSAFLVSLLLSVGASTWLYTKVQNRSGNNTQQSLIITGVAGAFLLIVSYSLLSVFM